MSITRYELSIQLVTTSALHSGGVEETVSRSVDSETEQPRTATAQRFARDGQGNPYLPGRSIKGAIRAACMRAAHAGGMFTSETMNVLWGGEDRASVLTVHPVVFSAKQVVTEQTLKNEGRQPRTDEAVCMYGEDEDSARFGLRNRPGIALDRYWGAVGDGALFMHEVLPSGMSLEVRISAHVDSRSGVRSDEVEALLCLIVDLFKSEAITFGKRKGAGWGGVKLAEDVTTADGTHLKPTMLTKSVINSPHGLLTWLDGGHEVNVDGLPNPVGEGSRNDRIRVVLEWNSPTGIMVADPERCEARRKAADTGEEKEGTPTEQWRDAYRGNLVIPGSAIRGALRSRATRIARTVLFANGRMEGDPQEDWSDVDVHEQLAGDVPLVHDLFGTTDRRGALRVCDVQSEALGKALTVTHNRGDRWTGGVVDGGLFSETYYPDATWRPIELEIDPAFLYRAPIDAAAHNDPAQQDGGQQGGAQGDAYEHSRRRASLILLGLVLAELATGTLPLGSRVTRGMGAVEVTDLTVTGPADLIGNEEWKCGGDGQKVAQQLLEKLRQLNEQICGNWTDYLTLEPQFGQERSEGESR